jgi:peroxiredoxin
MPLRPATPAPPVFDDLLASQGVERATRPLFLVFFRTDCPWCASEVPRLADVFARHQKLDILVWGIACGDDTAESAAAFMRDKNVKIPVLTDDGDALTKAFEISRVPSVVLINGHGLVERTFEGVTEQLTGILEQTLFAAAHDTTPPEYDMVGNGCAP